MNRATISAQVRSVHDHGERIGYEGEASCFSGIDRIFTNRSGIVRPEIVAAWEDANRLRAELEAERASAEEADGVRIIS